MSRLRQLKRGYEATAIVLLNTLFLILFLNLLLGIGFWAEAVVSSVGGEEVAAERLFRPDGAPNQTGKRTSTQLAWIDFAAYEDADPRLIGEMLDEFYELEQLGFVYQPWVQFAEPPFSSDKVNVEFDDRGFPVRRTINDLADDSARVMRIFAFGGSTTFGYNVSDEHTWPNALSRILNRRVRVEGRPYGIEVINYGRGYYYPGQEAVLLGDLLRSGHRPSLVIFMDGVNWGGIRDQPHLKPQVDRAFMDSQKSREIRAADFFATFEWVPMVRAVSLLNDWLDSRAMDHESDEGALTAEGWQSWVDFTVNRFRQAAQAARSACDTYGCRTLFVLQPNALLGYNVDLYRRDLPDAFTSRMAPTAELYQRVRQDSQYVDLSRLFELWGPNRKAIVDDLHYSPSFNEFLAEHVAMYIDLDNLPIYAKVVEESEATGAVRSVITTQGRVVPPVGGGLGQDH